MTLVLDLLMTTGWATCAFIVAWWRASTTWLRRMQYGSSAIASNLFKNSLEAAATRSLMAERLASVISTFQSSTTDPETDVLRLDVLLSCHATIFAFRGLTFTGFLLTWTAALSAFMSPAVESRSADSSTRWRFFSSLMAHAIRCSSTATTRYLSHFQTRPAITIVAYLLTQMTTGE